MASRTGSESAGQAPEPLCASPVDAAAAQPAAEPRRRRPRPARTAPTRPDDLVGLPGGGADPAPGEVAPAGRGDRPEASEPAPADRPAARLTVSGSPAGSGPAGSGAPAGGGPVGGGAPLGGGLAPVGGQRRAGGRGSPDGRTGLAGGEPTDGPGLLDGGEALDGGGVLDSGGLLDGSGLLDGRDRLDGSGLLDGADRLELRSVLAPPAEPVAGMPVLTGGGPVVADGAGAGGEAVDGADALVEASGIPPEVAAFLAESATAAGVELGPALRAAGVRSRRRSRTSPDRVQRSFYLSRDLVDRARAAVSATMDTPGEAYNVSQLAGRALENEVRRLERIYNGGKRFPPVTHVPSGPSPEGVERIRTGVTSPRRRRNAP
jgi:Centromere-binding protein ParB C-terminal